MYSKSKGVDFKIDDFPEFENPSQIITEKNKKCIINKNYGFTGDVYTRWREYYHDLGISDRELTKLIAQKRLDTTLTPLEEGIPFFIINKHLDVNILREMYQEIHTRK